MVGPDLNTDEDASALLGGMPISSTPSPITAPATGLNRGPVGGFQKPVTEIGTGGIQSNRMPAPPAAGAPAADPLTGRMMQSMERQDQLMAASMQDAAERRRLASQAQTEYSNTTRQVIAKELSSMKQASRYEAQDIGQAASQWMMLIGAFSALIGARGRGYSTAALNAFAGGIQGFTQGKQQQAEEHYRQWKANSDAALKDSETQLRKMELVLKDAKIDLDTKMAQIELIGAEHRDAISMEMARQKNFTMIAALYDKRVDLQEKIQLRQEELALKIQEHQDKMEERRAKMRNPPYNTPEGILALSQLLKVKPEAVLRQLHPGGAVLTNENLKPGEEPAAPAGIPGVAPGRTGGGWQSRVPEPERSPPAPAARFSPSHALDWTGSFGFPHSQGSVAGSIGEQVQKGAGMSRENPIKLTEGDDERAKHSQQTEYSMLQSGTYFVNPADGRVMQK